MLKNPWIYLIIMLLLISCGQGDGGSEGSMVSNITVRDTGDIEVNINLSNDVDNLVKVENVRSNKPGSGNAVETEITLRNITSSQVEVLVDGKWYDSGGNQYGGSSTVIILQPGQTDVLKTGTMSKNVSGYKVSISTNSRSQQELLADTLSGSKQKIAEGYGMTYSETATDEVIPALPITGVANGSGFQARTVAFAQRTQGKWELLISDYEFDVIKGEGYARSEKKDLQVIHIDFPNEPQAGRKYTREMSYGGGYFQIKHPQDSDETTSWNTSIAYAIEIEKWLKDATVGEPPCANPDTGTASGKLFISFKGSEEGPYNSWVSGEFRDVPIIYCSG